jgi:hypothetical protein
MIRRTALLIISLILGVITYNSLRSVPPDEVPDTQFVLPDVDLNIRAPLVLAPPLRTSGRHIVDANGTRVKLASVNWYGASDIYFVAGGLNVRHRDEIAATIKEMGFNSVRFPYSDQMVVENPIIDPEYLSANLDLFDGYDLRQDADSRKADSGQGPRALDVFNACVKAMTDTGLAVIINDHITNAAWCDGMNLCDSSWKNDQLWPFCKIQQTTQSWIENWKTIMKPFVDNPLVIGADLRNEPRGVWGTMTWKKWAEAAEQASEALLKMQPEWLMFVEGTSSANDCAYNLPQKAVRICRLTECYRLRSEISTYQTLPSQPNRLLQPCLLLVRLGNPPISSLSHTTLPIFPLRHGAEVGIPARKRRSSSLGGGIRSSGRWWERRLPLLE